MSGAKLTDPDDLAEPTSAQIISFAVGTVVVNGRDAHENS
ncbi:hypothetical protein ANO14919_133550 [Xylariales sp. No.14919]|nr:hypothetical protein ANO14919_133550 [Xylariales sp. No.14919]